MENITFGQFGITITFLMGLITGLGFLSKQLKGWIKQALKEEIDSIKKDVLSLQKKIDTVDRENCKNFLVARISELENGKKWGEIEKSRFWEQYEHYIQGGGNSYIKRKVEQLKADGKI